MKWPTVSLITANLIVLFFGLWGFLGVIWIVVQVYEWFML